MIANFMRFSWEFILKAFYNYPHVSIMNIKFEETLKFMNISANGLLIYENIEIENELSLSSQIHINKMSEPECGCQISVSTFNNQYRSGIYVYDVNGILYCLNQNMISFFRKSLGSMDIESVRVLMDHVMYEYDSCEKLALDLSGHIVNNMCLESEGGQIKEFFFNEVLAEIQLDNEMNSLDDLEKKILNARPLLSENVVQDLIDYIISIGAFVPIDYVI